MKVKPKRGDRVQLRGKVPRGVVKTIDDEKSWAVVEWDRDAPNGPVYVHLLELEIVE